MRIWKYVLQVQPIGSAKSQRVDTPGGAGTVRHVGIDPHGNLAVWIEVEDSKPNALFKWFWVYGTGDFVSTTHKEYVGTVVTDPYVWHVYGMSPQ